MPAPYDYTSQLTGPTGIADTVQRAVLGQQQQASNQQALAANALQMQLAERAAQRQQQMQADFATLAANPTAAGYAHFMTLYPEAHDALGKAWDALDKNQRDATLRTTSDVYARLQNGDTDGAISELQAHMDAATGAGEDTSNYPALIEAIRHDPKQAAALAGMALASGVGTDKFGEMFKALNPTPTDDERNYEFNVKLFGKPYADAVKMTNDTKFIPVQAGGTVAASGPAGIDNGAAPQPKGGDPSAATGFTMPVANGTFNLPGQQFGAKRPDGRTHDGLDISAPEGSTVTPIAAGKVVAVGNDKLSGNFVRVRHADGTVSSYGHLGTQNVHVGDAVGPGTSLGTVGTSGNATGPVVHLTVRQNGKAVDPRPLLTGLPVVRSKQAYDALPSGSEYIAPDGSHRRKG